MWNLALVEPLSKGNNFNGNGGANKFTGGYAGSKAKSPEGKKPDYCWTLNGPKGVCKFGECCKYVNRCSYCDTPGHGIVFCCKLERAKSGRSDGQSQGVMRNSPKDRKNDHK